MQAVIIRRLIHTVIVLFVLSLIVFMLIYFIPGDPVITMIGADATKEEVDALRSELGLDKPLLVQYSNWLLKVLQGDLGKSILYREEVIDLIKKRMPITLYLGFLALIITTVFGTLAGIICAVRRGTLLDAVVTVFANFGIAVPVFWLGIIGIYAFAIELGWLPVQGYTSPFKDFWLSTQQAIMPVICLAVTPLASIARQARSAMLEVIQQDYIRTAWSKGLKERIIIMRHALKNALIPVVTLLGMQARFVIGGSVLVETVFNIPGMGRLIVRSVFDKDFTIVQGAVLVTAIVVAMANLIVDISYAYLDPRVSYEE